MKLIILDRDGVINFDSDAFIKHPDEWHAIPGSLEAIAQLNQAGFYVAVASNQSGIGRGLFSLATLEAIHKKMHTQLHAVGAHIDALKYCPHLSTDDCACRKPKPGMLLELMNRYSVSGAETILIGDAWRDLEAAQCAHAHAYLVLTGKGQQTYAEHENDVPRKNVYADLSHAVAALMNKEISDDD